MSIKIGLIGCGRISERHLEVIKELDDVTVVGVTDIIHEKAEAKSKKFGVPFFENMESLIKNGKPDIVTIMTPSGYHADNVIEASKYGVHIIVEKPMSLKLDDADRMISACDHAGVKLFVVKQNRYNLPIQRLKRALDENRFGKLVMGTVRVRWCREQKYYDQDSWRGKWAMDGGVLANQASHHIDLLLWMMGEVETVMAMSATQLAKIEVDDTAVAIVKFTSGALGVIEATTATRPKDLEGSISILGENGSAEIAGFAVNEIRHWNFSESREEDVEILEKCRTNPPNVYGFGHREFYKAVINDLKTGHREKSLVDGLEGKKSLELINAIYESVERGKAVNLRFKPHWCKLGK